MFTIEPVRKTFLAICLWSFLAIPGSADIMILIEHEFVSPGQTALLGVFATSNSNDSISGFNLPVDFNADGKSSLPFGFTFNSTQIVNALFANTNIDVPEPQINLANIDGIATGFVASNFATTLSTTPTRLFDIAIDVSPSTAVGTVLPVHISQDIFGLFNVTSPSGGSVGLPTFGTPSIGSITVIAVPEPSTILLFATSIVMLICFRVRLSLSSCKLP